METLRHLRKNRLFMMGLLIPLLFQLIFLCIALPVIKDGNSRIHDMKIAIVNEDATELNGKIAGFVMATIGGPEYPLPM